MRNLLGLAKPAAAALCRCHPFPLLQALRHGFNLRNENSHDSIYHFLSQFRQHNRSMRRDVKPQAGDERRRCRSHASDTGGMSKQQTPPIQTEQESLETLADLLIAQDDLRGQPERGEALIEASQALQEYLTRPAHERPA